MALGGHSTGQAQAGHSQVPTHPMLQVVPPKAGQIHPQLLPSQGVSNSPGGTKALRDPLLPLRQESGSTAHHRDNGSEGFSSNRPGLVQSDGALM